MSRLPGLGRAGDRGRPAGALRDELPLGVQIIAPFGEDRTAIAVGAMLEETGSRYVPAADPLALTVSSRA